MRTKNNQFHTTVLPVGAKRSTVTVVLLMTSTVTIVKFILVSFSVWMTGSSAEKRVDREE